MMGSKPLLSKYPKWSHRCCGEQCALSKKLKYLKLKKIIRINYIF
jgi:hypothetical protein